MAAAMLVAAVAVPLPQPAKSAASRRSVRRAWERIVVR
jgi:hypothetical protein